MSSPSQARIAANRRNAKKSTGPRSASGKERARRNALRHGRAAEVLVPEDQLGAVAASIAEWFKEVGPDNVAERALLRRAAVADAHLRRGDFAAEESLITTLRQAVDRWRDARRKSVRRKAQRLKADPFHTLLDLEDSAFGCEWLIRQWTTLDRVLEQGLGWSSSQRDLAMRLIGYQPVEPGPDGAAEAITLWRLGRLAAGLEVAPVAGEPPLDPPAARATLRETIRRRVDRLDRLRRASWEAVEGPERSALIAQTIAGDISPEGLLRHRYHREATSTLIRALDAMIRLRRRTDQVEEYNRKKALESPIEREWVGGGWWKEPHAWPAPPGFQKIGCPPPTPPPGSPTDSPARAPAVEPTVLSAVAPTAKPTVEPTAKPAVEPTIEPTLKSTARTPQVPPEAEPLAPTRPPAEPPADSPAEPSARPTPAAHPATVPAPSGTVPQAPSRPLVTEPLRGLSRTAPNRALTLAPPALRPNRPNRPNQPPSRFSRNEPNRPALRQAPLERNPLTSEKIRRWASASLPPNRQRTLSDTDRADRSPTPPIDEALDPSEEPG